VLYSANIPPPQGLIRLTCFSRPAVAAVYGIDAHLIDVEVDFSQIKLDKEIFSTVGLPDAAVRASFWTESRDWLRIGRFVRRTTRSRTLG
jgi:hypothetical protein